MNPIIDLKEKLKIKPNLEERERVEVLIKGLKNTKKNEKVEKVEKDIMESDDKFSNNLKNVEEPIIVDETNKGYDRESLFKRLKESNIIKVSIKPTTIIQPEKKKEESNNIKLDVKKAKKINNPLPLILEDEEEEEEYTIKPKKQIKFLVEDSDEEKEKEKEEIIPITLPKKKERITEKLQKGVAILGPETLVEIGDTELSKRIPKKIDQILIKVSSYYMNDRELFVNFINSLFEPYRKEISENKENISCDDIGKTNNNFSLLTHQKIVRDYINLYTPYRGLLLYHGLGAGKTASSIAIAEGMKDSKRVIIMTPASLRANYIEELKKAGDKLYKRNQYWEWISTTDNSEALKTISIILNLPQEFIRKNNGAFFINIKKSSNYDELSDNDKKLLEEQLNEMIKQKYTFINYNGLRSQRLAEMTSGYKKNIFDNAVVIIDEAHNLISRIVNKLKKEKPILGLEKRKKKDEKEEKIDENIFGEQTPLNLSTKLYYMLLKAKNSKIVLLTGTPIINYPNEFAILFNILRGYIKTWKIPLVIKTNNKIDKSFLNSILLGEKSLDFLDYSPSSKILTITRNPYGFKNKIKKESGYQGVSNTKKDEKGNLEIDNDYISDEDFEKKIITILKRNEIDIVPLGIEIKNYKALPDDMDSFIARYINDEDKSLKNVDSLKRRIIGLSSFFKSAQENLLPKYNKQLGIDYHIIRIPMSDVQFKIYESARHEERKSEKPSKKSSTSEIFDESTSTYRIFSRLFCNYIMPDRPTPRNIKLEQIAKGWQEPVMYKDGKPIENKEQPIDDNFNQLLKEAKKLEKDQDINDEKEGEIEGDEVLEKIGGVDYKEKLENALKNLKEHSNDFLTVEALQIYSPKFLNMLENIQDPKNQGLNLVYSQFRTAEGIGIFSLVLEKNGFARFKIKKNSLGLWEIDISDSNKGKPTFALYTGTETSEEKEIIRHIYNGEWDQIPESIGSVLKTSFLNNNMGEVIKILMITSSGSEGINLRNTRYVHIMEPYWHPVRLEQVIGRARRICSHKDLPLSLQTVEVFIYLMIFSEPQLKSDSAIELKRKDLSKSIPKVPITSDQYLFEISEIKSKLTSQLTEAIKESAFDCYIYSNGKCVNFGDPSSDKFSYVPDFADQQNDSTVKANKKAIEWTGKPIEINGTKYIYRRVSNNVFDLYDKNIYLNALKDPNIVPLKIGTYEVNEQGERVLKLLVT